MVGKSSAAAQSEEDRRRFLKSCGRFAATVPPAMTMMLSTSLTSNAIAKSTGAGDTGNGHVDTGIKGGDRGTKSGGDRGIKHSDGHGGGMSHGG